MKFKKCDEAQQMQVWKQRILDAYNSESGVMRWLQENQIHPTNLYRWRRKLVVSGDISPDIFPRSEKKKQNKLELWKKRISDMHHSGLSVRQWCKQQGISRKAFSYWDSYLSGGSNEAAKVWKDRILEAYDSNLSISSWCDIHRISYCEFLRWKRVLIHTGDLPSVMSSWRGRKKNYWKQAVLDAYKSNTSVEDWCMRHKICSRVLCAWKRKLLDSGDILSSDLGKLCEYEHNKEYWKQLVLEAYTGKPRVEEWCKQNHVSYGVLLGWKKRLLNNGDIPKHLGKNRKKHRKDQSEREAMWRAIVIEAHKSNLTREAWCKENHISSSSFRTWEKHFIQKGEISTNMFVNYKQYKKKLWKQRILDAYNSNLTIKEWCKQNNISDSFFYDWKSYLEKSGDIPKHLGKILKQHINGKVQCVKKEKPSKKHEEIDPVFCELPIPEDIDLPEENGVYISKETTFRVGKFSLSVEEDVSEDMLNAALEALNTVMEVFSND